MPQRSSRAKEGNVAPSASLDLRAVPLCEIRTRAFSGMFSLKPGQRVSVLVEGQAAEKEIRQWVAEIGHRLIKVSPLNEGDRSYQAVEIVKIEARR